jgi:hypothetical protein
MHDRIITMPPIAGHEWAVMFSIFFEPMSGGWYDAPGT